MSAGNKIVNVRFEDGLYARLQEEIEKRNQGSRGEVWSISDYVRVAVLEKVAHSERGRKQVKVKKFTCEQCTQQFDMTKVGFLVKPLFGKKEYTCVYCVRVRPAGI